MTRGSSIGVSLSTLHGIVAWRGVRLRHFHVTCAADTAVRDIAGRRAWKRRTTGALAPSLAARTWGGAVWLRAGRSVLAYGGDRELTDCSGAAIAGSDAATDAAASPAAASHGPPAGKRKRAGSPSASSASPAAGAAALAGADTLASVISTDSRCALYDADASLWYPATTTAVGTKACPGDRSGHSMVLARDADSGTWPRVLHGTVCA